MRLNIKWNDVVSNLTDVHYLMSLNVQQITPESITVVGWWWVNINRAAEAHKSDEIVWPERGDFGLRIDATSLR